MLIIPECILSAAYQPDTCKEKYNSKYAACYNHLEVICIPRMIYKGYTTPDERYNTQYGK